MSVTGLVIINSEVGKLYFTDADAPPRRRRRRKAVQPNLAALHWGISSIATEGSFSCRRTSLLDGIYIHRLLLLHLLLIIILG